MASDLLSRAWRALARPPRQKRSLLLAVCVVAVLLTAACGGDNNTEQAAPPAPAEPTPAEPAPPPAEPAPPSSESVEGAGPKNLDLTPDETRELDPGDYQVKGFEPPFSFALGAPATAAGILPGEFDLTLDGDYLFFFNESALLLSPDKEQSTTSLTPDKVANTPEALVEWLQANPRITTAEPTSTTIGGLEATEIEIEAKESEAYQSDLCPGMQCVPLFHTPPNLPTKLAYWIAPGNPDRAIIVAVGENRLLILTESGSGDLAGAKAKADPVLGTVDFGD